MADNLSTLLSTWRGSNQGHQGLLSKLSIDGSLYDIKDPAVEYLAAQLETRISSIENKTIREAALSKPDDAGKFATSVTQGTDGQITVTYANFTGNNDAAVAGQFVTQVVQDEEGEITVSRAGVDDSQVTLSSATLTALGMTGTQSVSAALVGMQGGVEGVIGTSSDASTDNTIYGAKAYADAAVAALAGQDWEANAKKVQEIIAELEDSEHGNQWLTVLDKLSGMTITNKTATAADAAEYNEGLEGAVKAGHALTAAQASAVNAALGTSYDEGQTISTSDSVSYNATLTGHIAQGDTFTDTTPTVKEYVDAEIAKVQAIATGGIGDLDNVVYGGAGATGVQGANAATTYTADTTSQVAVLLTEVDGIVTQVDVKTNDLASASDLETLDGAAIKSVNGISRAANDTTGAITLTGADINVGGTGGFQTTKIDTAIGNLDSLKANKAAINSSNVNNWAASYASETLTWTNTSTAVYVPSGSGTL